MNKAKVTIKEAATYNRYSVKRGHIVLIDKKDIQQYGLAIALDLYIDRQEKQGYWNNWTNAQEIRKAFGL